MAKNKAITFCESPLGLKDFQDLPSDGETILLDEESLEVMYGIQETMRTLEPKGLDDIRTLRIETIGRRKSIVWYEVTIRIYKDMYGLSLSFEQGESYYFANKDNWIREEKPVRHNCKRFLERLWEYLYSKRNSKTGRWYLELVFDLELYADAGFRIATALEKAGVPFVVGDAEGKVAALSGEDIINFSPDSRDYQLPYPRENGITAEQVKQAIGLITWKRFEEVRCIAC